MNTNKIIEKAKDLMIVTLKMHQFSQKIMSKM